MKIVILRHGEASFTAASDRERELTPRGREQTLAAGRCLVELGLSFDAVWVSPYIRTRQTADEVLKAFPLSLSADQRETQPLLTPDNSPQSVVDAIATSGLDSLLLISHQPLVSSLAGLLTQSRAGYGPPMSPASMALIEAEHVLVGCCDLISLRHAPTFEASHV